MKFTVPIEKPVGRWRGTWRPMPAAPLSAREGAATDYAVYEDRIYVWGGRDASGALLADGAAYLVDEGSWVMLPEAGLEPRERFAFDSDGQDLLIWGGVDVAGQPLGEGAVLELAPDGTMAWAPLPSAPLAAGPASVSGDRNDQFGLSAAGNSADPPTFAVYDQVDEDRKGWDDPSSPDERNHGDFPPPPLPPGISYEVSSVRGSALAISYQADGTAIVSWFGHAWPGEWSEPQRVPLPLGASCPARDLPRQAWMRPTADGSVVALVTSATDEAAWIRLPDPPDDATGAGMLVLGPSHLIAADDLLAFDFPDGRWRRLPEPPGGARTDASAAWFDGELYLWGGRTADGTIHDTGWIFTPDLPADTFRLPGGHRGGYGDCAMDADPGRAEFRADRADPELVWLMRGGERLAAVWADGFTVRFGRGGAVVVGPDGRVVARVGQRLRSTGLFYCGSADAVGITAP